MSNKLKRGLLISVLLGAIIGGWAVWYVFYKPHRNVSSEKAAYELSSKALSESVKTDTASIAKYLDQVILVSGPVTAVEGTHVFLENIDCNLDSSSVANAPAIKVGDEVKIQGRFSTYNDLMEEIMLDQCTLK